ncbi:MAG: GxxExxY protein [Bacteroidota bacterium]|nr:GxxExxY protein [Bacteroidota bacterium]
MNANLRADILVVEGIIVELKSIDSLNTIHTAQLLSYLKLMNKKFGLLINFNVPKQLMVLKELSIDYS